MKNWIRIVLLCFVLIGGTMCFGYWSFSQFNNVFDNLDVSYLTSTSSTSVLEPKKTDNKEYFLNTLPETALFLTASTDFELASTFLQKGNGVYRGCTYKMYWKSSTTNALEIVLIDAGTKKAVESIYSGLVRESDVEKGLQNVTWKVGMVWPGEYYILVSRINGVDREIKSKTFTVKKTPETISKGEMAGLCSESNGQL